ncbi:hypothetical protein SAMN05216600_10728 [Pseudomonas cuatrocienegasensis]|uniref:Uncharacterized protein n=1 Tax=Pseudomonas cuatrocienegasensis TaxID=543360 RepID=A0ABY1BCN5_9PSED|nr:MULTISPECIES: hypothetical protein [Pseudomonas]SEQ55037.1 hypothetical protein SAMN05216600_10728 [Pseudomonas cuatrocienegasensis]
MRDLTPLLENNERWLASWRDLGVSGLDQLAPQYRLCPLPRV